MEWRGRRQSRNVEDRRGQSRRGGVAAGGAGVIVLLLLGAVFGVDVTPLLQGTDPGPQQSRPLTEEERAVGDFAAVTLGYTETVWGEVFAGQLGQRYEPPVMVLFSEATQSACGGASQATGPFYCPADRRIYLDTAFFVTLEHRLGAGGDFAAAYVIGHEVAHHVQNLLGILPQVHAARARAGEADSNALSVMTELQADCLAGIWARGVQAQLGAIEPGDFEEALGAARAIGDDTLQRAAGQRPMPHTFTHGTSEQRMRWFMTGLETGRIDACDTFSAPRL